MKTNKSKTTTPDGGVGTTGEFLSPHCLPHPGGSRQSEGVSRAIASGLSRRKFLGGLGAALALPQLARPTVANAQSSNASQRNILLIILDDVGVDQVPQYVRMYPAPNEIVTTSSIANPFTRMDVLDRLCQAGVTFMNAWSSPLCSPTRACLYTGKYSFHHGVYVTSPAGSTLPTGTTTVARVLKTAGYTSGLFGKWHLGGDTSDPCADSTDRPVDFSWDTYTGAMGGGLESYSYWDRIYENSNGVSRCDANYGVGRNLHATTETMADALLWINGQVKGTKPWMATVAFNAPHAVGSGSDERWEGFAPEYYQARSASLRRFSGDEYAWKAYYRSLLEHVDICIGRLLAGIPQEALEKTTIIVMGDNGTPDSITDHFGTGASKGSLNEGGIKVPLIIADGYAYLHPGAGSPSGTGRVVSPGRAEYALVQTLDVFATCAAIGNAKIGTVDSISLAPYLENSVAARRTYVFAERRPSTYKPGDAWACTTAGWDVAIAAKVGPKGETMKLIVEDFNQSTNSGSAYSLYDLTNDPWERSPLAAAGSSYTTLKDTLLPYVFPKLYCQ